MVDRRHNVALMILYITYAGMTILRCIKMRSAISIHCHLLIRNQHQAAYSDGLLTESVKDVESTVLAPLLWRSVNSGAKQSMSPPRGIKCLTSVTLNGRKR